MPDQRHARGLIDTSVVIDLELIEPGDLPLELAVSAITMAELAAGPHATADPERARRQDRLQRAEATFEPLPADGAVARAYGRIYAAVGATDRKARGRRAVDLFIAATAVAVSLPLYTHNPDDFAGLSDMLEIVSVWVSLREDSLQQDGHGLALRHGERHPKTSLHLIARPKSPSNPDAHPRILHRADLCDEGRICGAH